MVKRRLIVTSKRPVTRRPGNATSDPVHVDHTVTAKGDPITRSDDPITMI